MDNFSTSMTNTDKMADSRFFVFDGRSRKDPHLNAGTVKYHNKHSVHIIRFAASLTKIMDEP